MSHPAAELVMVRRVAATQAVVDAWRGRPFAWGSADCARLAAAMLRQLGWSPRAARFGGYRSLEGARRALERRGMTDMADVIDELGPLRQPFAASLPGDLLGFRHPDQPLGVGIGVAVGNGRALGFLDNGDGGGPRCHVFPPIMRAAGAEYLAWRCPPRD